MAKHILQDDRAALERRKPHESAQTHRGGLVVLIRGIRRGNHVEGLVMVHHWTARATTEKIERSVVGDAEQPAFRVVDDTDTGQGGKGFNQCVLDNILAIDSRAGHAGAVSMELGTNLTHQLLELIARISSHCLSRPRNSSARWIIRYVERQDVAFAAKAVGDAVSIARIAEQFSDLFSKLRRAQDRAITVNDMLLDADTLDLRAGSRNLMAERGTGNQLHWHEDLKMDPEVTFARDRVCTVSHEPQHPFGAYIASREAQAFGRDEWHRKHHGCSARHDQNTATSLHRSVECGLNADQSCLHIGVPDGRELVPVLPVDRLYRQPRAGVEDQHVGHLLADHLVHKGCVGCVAGNHRSAGMLGGREVRSIAANCDYVRATGSELLHHREPQSLAATGNDHTFSVQVLHIHSPFPGHQAWWL